MKKYLLIFSIATVSFAACKDKKDETLEIDKNIVLTDTSLLKPGNNSTDVSQLTDNQTLAPQTAPPVQQPERVREVVRIIERERAPRRTTTPPVVVEETPTSVPAPVPVPTTTDGTGTTPGTTAGTTTIPEAPKKTGWSDAAKGAAIGGVGGAVAGAVIGKGKGAIIGGVVGAAGGYIIGRGKDKKSGRVDTTKN